MNTIKTIITLSILLFSTFGFAQDFNGYKYIVVNIPDYGANGKDIYGIGTSVANYFKKKDYQVIYGNEEKLFPNELKFNKCLGLFISINQPASPPYEVTLNFINCKNQSIKLITGKASVNSENALNRIFNQLDKMEQYIYNISLAPKIDYPEVENINKTEAELKAYFDSTKTDAIEGIYKAYKSESNYKLGIFKVGELYKAIIIESDFSHWKKGDIKAIFESTAVEGVFSTKYYMGDKTSIETFANVEGGLINIELYNQKGENNDMKLLKLYPKN